MSPTCGGVSTGSGGVRARPAPRDCRTSFRSVPLPRVVSSMWWHAAGKDTQGRSRQLTRAGVQSGARRHSVHRQSRPCSCRSYRLPPPGVRHDATKGSLHTVGHRDSLDSGPSRRTGHTVEAVEAAETVVAPAGAAARDAAQAERRTWPANGARMNEDATRTAPSFPRTVAAHRP
jgi:hypothetical protein